MKLLFIIFILISSQKLCWANQQNSKMFFVDRERGWFWYETRPIIEERENEKEEQLKKQPSLIPKEILQEQGKNWENSLAKAIIDPNQENIHEYLRATKIINEQAQKFSTSFKEAIWVNPEYDYSLERPIATQAIVAQNEDNFKEQEILLRKMAKSHGLIFFFSGSCPHCQRFAPLFRKFTDFYKFSVIPVSINGEGLAEFPQSQKNLHLGNKLNVSTVPAIFMVDPLSNKVAAVSYGYVDWTTLSQKILSAYKRIQVKEQI